MGSHEPRHSDAPWPFQHRYPLESSTNVPMTRSSWSQSQSLAAASRRFPVMAYHGLCQHPPALGFVMRPLLNGDTLYGNEHVPAHAS